MKLDELCSKLAALSSKARERYAIQAADEMLGCGLGRDVYGVGDFAVKLLNNPDERFQQESDVAVMKLFAGSKYIPQLYAYDARNFEFLVMERLTPLKDDSEIPSKRKVEKLCRPILEAIPTLDSVLFLELYERPEHWGYSKDGNLKALDFGC